MVKQTKTFKKGNVTKKALSAILAASMVMTSSSFVMAAPVEVEDVAVEAAAVDVVEDVDAGEESVGEVIQTANVTVEDVTYAAKAIEPTITVKNSKGETVTNYTVQYVKAADKADSTKYTAKVKDAGDYVALITMTGTDTGDTPSGVIEKAFKVKPFDLKDAKVTYTETGYIYNGEAQAPFATVTVAGLDSTKAELKAEIEAKIAVDATNANTILELAPSSDAYDMKSAGSQQVKLQLKKDVTNYVLTGSLETRSYVIDQRNGFASSATVTAENMVYTGSVVTPTVVVKDGTTVVDPSSYDVVISLNGKVVEPKDVNKESEYYTITVTTNGKGNYKEGATATGKFKIVNSSLTTVAKEATIKGTTKNKDGVYEAVYTGSAQTFKAEDIAIPGLTQGVDYSVAVDKSLTDVKDSVATVTFTGMNKYVGQTATATIKVVPKEITTTGYTITAKASKGTTEIADVIVSVKNGDKELERGSDKDYTAEFNAAKTGVIIKGVGNYTTAKEADGTTQKGIEVPCVFSEKNLIDDEKKVLLCNATKDTVITTIGDQSYTGTQITPSVTLVKYDSTKANKIGDSLTKGVDYTVAYGENTKTGEATITVTGIGDYEGTKVIKFNIIGADDEHKLETGKYIFAPMSDVTLDEAKDGKGQVASKLVYKDNGASAPAGVTYDVKYFSDSAYTNDITSPEAFAKYVATLKDDNLPVTIYVKAVGTGAYSGDVTQQPLTTWTPAGYVKTAAYQIIAGDAAFTVDAIADQDYTSKAVEPAVVVKKDSTVLKKDVDYTVTYDNNVKVGTAYAIVKGIGKYTGTKVVSFNIVGEMDQTIEVLAAQERDLGNGSRTLNSKATKIKFAKAPETEVTYTSSDENVVTVDAEGNVKYTGLGEATITIEAKAENGYKAAKKEVKVVVTLAKPSFTPFSKNNAFTVTSSTVKGAEKFEVEYATKKDFSNSKTKTFTTTSAGKVRQVKVSAGDKKTYYVRVRAISGTTKSAWSATKTVATK